MTSAPVSTYLVGVPWWAEGVRPGAVRGQGEQVGPLAAEEDQLVVSVLAESFWEVEEVPWHHLVE